MHACARNDKCATRLRHCMSLSRHKIFIFKYFSLVGTLFNWKFICQAFDNIAQRQSNFCTDMFDIYVEFKYYVTLCLNEWMYQWEVVLICTSAHLLNDVYGRNINRSAAIFTLDRFEVVLQKSLFFETFGFQNF